MTAASEKIDEVDAPEAPRPSRWRRLGLAAPAYLPALMIAVGGWQHRWMDEDAFINLRIVDQIFAGHGPVFNACERVEASTSTRSPSSTFQKIVACVSTGGFSHKATR